MNEAFMYMGVLGIASMITTVFIFWQRAGWQKTADTHVQLLVIPRAGNRRYVLGKVEGNVVVVEQNEKKGIPGKIYPINDVVTYEAPYPPEFPVPFLRTNIREMAVYAWNWEPITNPTNDPLMSPELLYNFEHEKFSHLFLATSQMMADYEEKLQKALSRSISPMVIYALMGTSIVISGYLVYQFMPLYEQLQGLIEEIKALAAAFGV